MMHIKRTTERWTFLCRLLQDSIFKDRNYTPGEQAYCSKAPHPSASYAGKWCAKEAVVKALTSVNPSMKGRGRALPKWAGVCSCGSLHA